MQEVYNFKKFSVTSRLDCFNAINQTHNGFVTNSDVNTSVGDVDEKIFNYLGNYRRITERPQSRNQLHI